MVLTSGQVRAARGFLGWSARELAEQASLGLSTIQRLEAGGLITAANMAAICTVFDRAGIEFIPENGGGAGVRMRKNSAGEGH